MSTMRIRVLFFLLISFSQTWLASAAPEPKQNPTGPAPDNKPLMGVGVTADGLKKPDYEAAVRKYFSLLTAGNEMKWDLLEQNPHQFNFAPATEIYEYAKKNNKKLRIHTMFAHSQNPTWIGSLQKEELQKAMTNILGEVIRRFSDKAIAMDVCNEILNDQGNLDDNVWKKTLGESWVDFAYQTAKGIRDQHNKDMLLYINDYSIEGKNPKSDGMLKLATRLHKAGLLDAVGFQCHFVLGQVPKDFKENLERFTAAGLKVALTEVDVRIQLNGQQTASPQDLEAKAQDYKTIYETCSQVQGCVSVTTWGLTPEDSWIGKNGVSPGWGDATLFENGFKPSKAFQAIREKSFANTGP